MKVMNCVLQQRLTSREHLAKGAGSRGEQPNEPAPMPSKRSQDAFLNKDTKPYSNPVSKKRDDPLQIEQMIFRISKATSCILPGSLYRRTNRV
jgi:hypothetical protein